MKQFFKFVLATIVGVFVAGLVILVVFVGIIVAASSDKEVKIDDNSILTISLKNAVPERTPNNPLANLGFLGFDEDKSVGLNDILASIKKAKDDKQIKGIYLADNLTLSGQATTEEIRNALIDFKKSKKFIIAYAEVYTQSSYYLASVADKVYMNPKGIFDFAGMSQQITFFKGALDKSGVEAQVIKVGTYKSAVEPFILDKMSDANREQVTSYLGSLNNQMLTGISNSRHINKDSLFSIAYNLKVRMPEDAVTFKLIDGLKYKDEVLNELKGLTKVDLKKNLHAVAIESYAQNDGDDESEGDKDTDNQIAMVYASGEINGGNGDDNTIGSDRISATLRQARLNDKVKAVVLRVNSPGGSSLASDVIWREVSLTKKVKPVIVSMGDYAASGGYYISCAADSIFAEPNTITGSIGIFAILPNMRGLLTGKLGLTFDGVKTGRYADLGDVTRPLTPEERAILQSQVNRGYGDFTGAVAAGRKKTTEYINSIGQGRVWTGEQAIKIGLVDRLGNIKDALASAAKKAGIKKYKVVAYPEQKSFFKSLSSDMQSRIQTRLVKAELGESYTYYQQLKTMNQMMHTPQARLPFFATMK